MLVVGLHTCSTRRLLLEGMQLAVSQEQRFRGVLVVMGERAVALSDVEAEDHEGEGADELLLEGFLLLESDLVTAYIIILS